MALIVFMAIRLFLGRSENWEEVIQKVIVSLIWPLSLIGCAFVLLAEFAYKLKPPKWL